MSDPKAAAHKHFLTQLEAAHALGLTLKQYLLSPDCYRENHHDLDYILDSRDFIEDLRRWHPEKEVKLK